MRRSHCISVLVQGPVQALGSADPLGCQQICSAATTHRDVCDSDVSVVCYGDLRWVLPAPTCTGIARLHVCARARQPVPAAMPGRLCRCMVHCLLGTACWEQYPLDAVPTAWRAGV